MSNINDEVNQSKVFVHKKMSERDKGNRNSNCHHRGIAIINSTFYVSMDIVYLSNLVVIIILCQLLAESRSTVKIH